MHEQSLIKSLIKKIHRISANENRKLLAAKLRLGAMAHISAEHLREHFEHETAGTPLEGIFLEIEELPDINHPEAQEIILESLEFENHHGD